MTCHVTLVPQFSPKIEKHPEIVISNSDDNNEVVLGRCDITGITDKRCSREHTKLKLDVNSNELVLTQLGSNPCSVSDCDGNTYILAKHDVKRLPIKKLDIVRNGKSILYLINKDLLYGYKLVVREETKTDCSSVKAKTSSSVSGSKRPQPTLDSYISKKIKKCDAGKASLIVIVGEWTEPSSLTYMFTPADGAASSKIIGFDMDGTLIVTKSGAKWPKDKDDWNFGAHQFLRSCRLCTLMVTGW
ncbi:hypothetical protein EB796_004927 [Bugula neritina]|uniref:FHA domain-containing protein n=1 Tax=Bugula neritina TaxID=10212 RepID=A0A7J7KGI8_BUGNE|nr:hypothetical protein EB796_004927 [Bugula neritina]